MSKCPPTSPVTTRVLLSVAGVIVIAAVVYFTSRPPNGADRPKDPKVAKREIYQFLKEKSGRTDFATTVPTNLLANAEIEQIPVAAAVRDLPQEIPRLRATAEFRRKSGQGEAWAAIYGLFGEQLWIADQLLLRKDAKVRETGVIVAAEVARQGIREGIDPWFAPRVAEAYLWPAIQSVEKQGAERLTVSGLGNLTRFLFQRARETNNIVFNYELIIEHTTNSATADRARMGLVGVYESRNEYGKALEALRAVQTSNEFIGLRISNLVHKLQATQPAL